MKKYTDNASCREDLFGMSGSALENYLVSERQKQDKYPLFVTGKI